MGVFIAKLSKETLSSAKSTERALFIIMAHLANEINVLNKLYFWAGENPTSNKTEENGKLAMGLMFLRLLAGKLKEGNELLVKYFHGTAISVEYVPKLKPEGKEVLEKIKQYFSRSNVINKIRNSYAFHYSPDELDSVLPSIPEELETYISNEGSANTLYYFAEVLANRAILFEIDPSNDISAYQRLVKEIPTVAGWFAKFADYLIVEFVSKHGQDIWDGDAKEIEFSNLSLITEIELPWFTDTSPLRAVDPKP